VWRQNVVFTVWIQLKCTSSGPKDNTPYYRCAAWSYGCVIIYWDAFYCAYAAYASQGRGLRSRKHFHGPELHLRSACSALRAPMAFAWWGLDMGIGLENARAGQAIGSGKLLLISNGWGDWKVWAGSSDDSFRTHSFSVDFASQLISFGEHVGRSLISR